MIERIKTLRYKYRTRFQKLHPLNKILLTWLFLILFVLGIIALIPLPEIGIPLVLISLSVLSFKYKWAEQLLNSFEKLFAKKAVKISLLVIGIVVVSFLVLLWLR